MIIQYNLLTGIAKRQSNTSGARKLKLTVLYLLFINSLTDKDSIATLFPHFSYNAK